MNGAESLIRTALNCGVDVCFANPGTTEMPLVAALDGVARMRAVLALFEGVVTGAADGYARMAGRPALTLTHLGPGFANGIANLHNARRAHSPIVNVIGDHATWHLAADAPLTSDIESLASPGLGVGAQVGERPPQSPATRPRRSPRRQRDPASVATLIVPADCQWSRGRVRPPAPRADRRVRRRAGDSGVRAAAEGAAARRRERPCSSWARTALRERGLRAAARIAATMRLPPDVRDLSRARRARRRDCRRSRSCPTFPEQALDAHVGNPTFGRAGGRARAGRVLRLSRTCRAA